MPPFHVDHNVSQRLTRLLVARGYDAVAAHDLGLDRASDARHLLLAAKQGRIVLTHNERDFLLLHDAWLRWSADWGVEPHHAGIIVLPQKERWDAYRSLEEIESLLGRAPQAGRVRPMTDLLWRWQARRGWFEFSGLIVPPPPN